ncbi:MAG TPA: phosphoribosylglycinamide formyltransferase [Soehngenia sp.]|nr:phosphoribosylglycinamide formyltransferase [Soehngenia sp.]HPP31924.1 phosphoribosylglycinamide formyltransferase [Soehngenia sp.]
MPVKKIAVLISGSGTNLQAIIDAISQKKVNAEIKIVISNNKDAYGLFRAEKHGIKNMFLSAKNLTDEEYSEKLLEIFKKEEIDFVVLAGFLKILSKDLVMQYKNRIINIHPSLIPSFCGKGYYGIKVHEKAIEYGVKVTGATVHFVDENADTGPIIEQRAVDVDDFDTAKSLQQKVLAIEHEILVSSLKKLCDDELEVIGRRVIKKGGKDEKSIDKRI